jgi:oxygen-independent coproporphyrinogen III oxidase
MYSLYFHIPFCVHRCAYCDFNTYAGQERMVPAYVEALCREIRQVAGSAAGRMKVHTVYFGGGTPSLLSASQFESILRSVDDYFDLTSNAEVCLEANPGTVSLEGLRDLRKLGFNRLSLGVQSAHSEELHQLERIHDYFDVIDAVKWARQAGIANLNLDLIYGLPGQPLERWQETVNLILGLQPEHLSLYALTIEPGTPFGRWVGNGRLPLPEPDVAADMLEWASDRLAQAGYGQYEISNWAKPGFQCRHNLQYWRGQPYLGFGAGAHGYAAGMRYSNALRIKTYIDHFQEMFPRTFPLSSAAVDSHHVSPRVEMQETMMTGLRLTDEGVSNRSFRARFGRGLMEAFGNEIDDLVRLGLLEWEEANETIRLTRRGRQVGNQAFLRFVD